MRGTLNSVYTSVAIRLVTGLLCGLVIIGIRSTGLLQQLELNTYDWQLRSRPPQTLSAPRIAYITISEEDIR